MSRELHQAILQDLSDRKSWEDKQRIYYEMRHQGLRRSSKPYPGAADMHYPLVDGLIDKFRPFYFAQIFGNDTVARFVGLSAKANEYAAAVGQWFDWQLLQRTNLFEESLTLIDAMLLAGGSRLKVVWNQQAQRLQFEAVEPLNLIVPADTKDLDEADRITHVLTFSEDAFRRSALYQASEETIARIKGAGTSENDGGGREQEKYRREGVTHTRDGIVVWEVYEPVGNGDWLVTSFSPNAPEERLREPFVLTQASGGQPFVDFPAEIKDKGIYSPRGIAERGGPFETYLCKVWNEKADAMTFYNRPLFTRDGNVGELSSIDLRPGALIPGGIRRVETGSVPLDFDAEMLNTRMTAEQMFAVPDFGLGNHIDPKQRKTATEVSYMAGLMSMSTDLRAWVFRHSLTKVYRRGWTLLRARAAQSLSYYVGEQLQTLDAAALQENYEVMPDGSPDGWNKQQRLQRAGARYQQYFGKPYINQAELTRHTLEEDDPRVARRLFQPPEVQAADQGEDQAMEILLLEAGYSAIVRPADDHNMHLQIIAGRLQQRAAEGMPLDARAAQAYLGHVQGHLQALAQGDRGQAGQWARQLQPFLQVLQQIAQPPALPQGAQPGMDAPAGMPMRQGMPMPMGGAA